MENMATGVVIKEVLDFLFKLQYDPWTRMNFYEDDVMTLAYSKHAAEDILEKLSNSNTAPLIVLEEYRDLMDNYCLKNRSSSEVFRIGGDIAQYFIDLISS